MKELGALEAEILEAIFGLPPEKRYSAEIHRELNRRRLMSSETVKVIGTVFGETEKAFKFSDDGNEKNAVWLPKSQCIDLPTDLNHTHTITVELPEWLAKKNGLI